MVLSDQLHWKNHPPWSGPKFHQIFRGWLNEGFINIQKELHHFSKTYIERTPWWPLEAGEKKMDDEIIGTGLTFQKSFNKWLGWLPGSLISTKGGQLTIRRSSSQYPLNLYKARQPEIFEKQSVVAKIGRIRTFVFNIMCIWNSGFMWGKLRRIPTKNNSRLI